MYNIFELSILRNKFKTHGNLNEANIYLFIYLFIFRQIYDIFAAKRNKSWALLYCVLIRSKNVRLEAQCCVLWYWCLLLSVYLAGSGYGSSEYVPFVFVVVARTFLWVFLKLLSFWIILCLGYIYIWNNVTCIHLVSHVCNYPFIHTIFEWYFVFDPLS